MASVIDTHTLVWFLEGGRKVGSHALQVLRDPQECLVIPSIVLAELRHLAHQGRTPLTLKESEAAQGGTPPEFPVLGRTLLEEYF